MKPSSCACGRLTDGKRPVCCCLCGDGRHTTACAIRQVGYGQGPGARSSTPEPRAQ